MAKKLAEEIDKMIIEELIQQAKQDQEKLTPM